MPADFEKRIAEICADIRSLSDAHHDTREHVAACEQKDRDLNGSIARIEDSQRRTEEKLDALCEAFAEWKGRAAPLLSAASAFVGALVAGAITFLRAHLGGN